MCESHRELTSPEDQAKAPTLVATARRAYSNCVLGTFFANASNYEVKRLYAVIVVICTNQVDVLF